jgi:hypothetical protein
VRTKLQSLAEKGAAAPSAEKAAWEKRVLGAVKKIDESDVVAILDQAEQDVKNELIRFTHSAQLTKKANKPKDISEVKQQVSCLQSFVESDPWVADLDKNPFKPANFRKTITASMSAVSKLLK